jgi:hypothetical protein
MDLAIIQVRGGYENNGQQCEGDIAFKFKFNTFERDNHAPGCR